MTIDEAIAKYREKAEWFKMTTNVAYVLELENIAEWLEELKDHRERECNHINEALYDKGFANGYNKAIDDFVKACKENIMYKTFGLRECDIEQIAEQLKAGEENV